MLAQSSLQGGDISEDPSFDAFASTHQQDYERFEEESEGSEESEEGAHGEGQDKEPESVTKTEAETEAEAEAEDVREVRAKDTDEQEVHAQAREAVDEASAVVDTEPPARLTEDTKEREFEGVAAAEFGDSHESLELVGDLNTTRDSEYHIDKLLEQPSQTDEVRDVPPKAVLGFDESKHFSDT